MVNFQVTGAICTDRAANRSDSPPRGIILNLRATNPFWMSPATRPTIFKSTMPSGNTSTNSPRNFTKTVVLSFFRATNGRATRRLVATVTFFSGLKAARFGVHRTPCWRIAQTLTLMRPQQLSFLKICRERTVWCTRMLEDAMPTSCRRTIPGWKPQWKSIRRGVPLSGC